MRPYKKILIALSVILLLGFADPVLAQEKLGFTPDAAALKIADLQFTGENGQLHNIREWRGKLVLLNIWATWCPPCRDEMPGLAKLQKQFSTNRFQVLPVSVDSNHAKAAARKFYDASNVKNLPVLYDADGSLQQQLALRSIPVSILIAPDGTILGRAVGDAPWGDTAATNMIASYLK